MPRDIRSCTTLHDEAPISMPSTLLSPALGVRFFKKPPKENAMTANYSTGKSCNGSIEEYLLYFRDLRCENEIIFGQPTDRMRHERYRYLPPPDREVRMMSFGLCDGGDLVRKIHCFYEILESELAGEAEPVGSYRPSRRLFEQFRGFISHKRERSPFARYAVFGYQVAHRKTLACAYDALMDALWYRLRQFVETVLDTVLPRSARRVRAESMRPEDLLIDPETDTLLGAEVSTLGRYQDLRDPIQSLKYDRSIKSAQLLAGALAEYLREDIASKKLFSQKPVLLIPIPLDAKRRRDRGYNQIGLVIDALPEEFKNGKLSRIAGPLLERTRTTRQQTKLVRAARLSNVAGAFSVADADLVHGTSVYVIDDVATTGATLVHAGHPLREAGAEVTLLALARA